ERVVLHAHECPTQQIDPVEHDATGNEGLAAAEIAFGLAQAHCAGLPTEIERLAQSRGDPLERSEIEIDDIPSAKHVGVERCKALAECAKRCKLARTSRRALGHRSLAAVDDQH